MSEGGIGKDAGEFAGAGGGIGPDAGSAAARRALLEEEDPDMALLLG